MHSTKQTYTRGTYIHAYHLYKHEYEHVCAQALTRTPRPHKLQRKTRLTCECRPAAGMVVGTILLACIGSRPAYTHRTQHAKPA